MPRMQWAFEPVQCTHKHTANRWEKFCARVCVTPRASEMDNEVTRLSEYVILHSYIHMCVRGHVCVSACWIGAFVLYAGPHAKSTATIAVLRSNKWKPNILNCFCCCFPCGTGRSERTKCRRRRECDAMAGIKWITLYWRLLVWRALGSTVCVKTFAESNLSEHSETLAQANAMKIESLFIFTFSSWNQLCYKHRNNWKPNIFNPLISGFFLVACVIN